MNIDIEQAIEERIQEVSVEKLRLEQALALIRGGSPMAKAAGATSTSVPKKKNESAATKRRTRWRSSKPKPWKPAAHAKPATRAVYDILEDGTAYSTPELLEKALASGVEMSKQQLWGVTGHMKDTGRIMYQNGKWRRKHARHPENKPPSVEIGPGGISATVVEGQTKQEVIDRLDQYAEEGELEKVEKAGAITYRPRYIAPGNARDS